MRGVERKKRISLDFGLEPASGNVVECQYQIVFCAPEADLLAYVSLGLEGKSELTITVTSLMTPKLVFSGKFPRLER
jgi:hypothetical protein